MNCFERHGITHLSPSSINSYAEQPSKWVISYLFGIKDPENAAMVRGKAVEDGLASYLHDGDLDRAVAVALTTFEAFAQGECNDENDKERAAIPGMVEQAAIAVEANGFCERPDAKQLKVEYWFDGIEVPVIGYVDFSWPNRGLELKSTHRLPSDLSVKHALQAGFYSACKSRPFHVLYVTKSKHALFLVDDAEAQMRRIRSYVQCIKHVLSASTDAEQAARFFAPDFDHPYLWKNDAAREAAAKIWS